MSDLPVVVSNNVVARIVSGDAAIPSFGYVIHFRGNEMQELKKFVPGAKIEVEAVAVLDG